MGKMRIFATVIVMVVVIASSQAYAAAPSNAKDAADEFNKGASNIVSMYSDSDSWGVAGDKIYTLVAAPGAAQQLGNLFAADSDSQSELTQIFTGTDLSGGQKYQAASAIIGQNFLSASYTALGTNTEAMVKTQQNAAGINTLAARMLNDNRGIGNVDAMASRAIDRMLANRVWVGGFGLWQDQDSKDGYSGYDYKSGGAILGYDRLFGNVLVGGSFAYARGSLDFDDQPGDYDTDSYSFNLYAKYFHSSGFENTLGGGYTYVKNEFKHTVPGFGNREGDNHTNVWSIGDTIGWRIPLGMNFAVTPSIGLYYSEAKSGDYTTRGVVTHVTQDKVKSLVMPIDLNVEYTQNINAYSAITVGVHGGYRHDFKDDAPTGITYVPFDGNNYGISTVGMKNATNVGNVGASLKYETTRFDVFMNYDFNFRSKFNQHRVLGGFGVKF